MTLMLNYLQNWHVEDGASLFTITPEGRTYSNDEKRDLAIYMSNKMLAVRVVFFTGDFLKES